MGCTASNKVKMSKQLHDQLIEAFAKLDTKTSNRISISQMDDYWTGPYSKTYTQVLFKEMDLDANGMISKDEWIAYWELALRAGYTQNQIRDCIKSIKGGKLQMEFSRVRAYDQQKSRESLVTKIIEEISDQFFQW